MKTALLIPCYEPSENVISYLKTFKGNEFDYYVVVNDGSGEEYDSIFNRIEKETVFDLFSYKVNKGKGGALKAGFNHILNIDPAVGYIVTCDSDGQHAYEDVIRVKEKAVESVDHLVIGTRQFDKKEVPLRSRVGNNFSKLYFKLVTKVNCLDTQTGLRAIPNRLFDLALYLPGSRFEYEMNFLIQAVREVPLDQVAIKTIYEEKGKHVSHFKTLKDSYLIYRTPIWYILVSLISFGIDFLLFTLLSSYVFTSSSESQVFLSNLIARITSGAFNFLMLNFFVFKTKGDIASKSIKYWGLWIINYGVGSGLTYLFKFLPMALYFIKVIIDAVIAIINYIINLTFVFTKRKIKSRHIKERKVA
ncbi:MAG: bifunctional glycosyltransferase family 2/GtrA family protein [Bacilli bacterium]|nr:bifunctional glycosyltransferase family 2/GtrA family protein [Bacilli bacterium]